jgi:hypothetical protein
MKKITIIALLSMFYIAASANINTYLFGGFTGISMKAVNDYNLARYGTNSKNVKFNSGYMAGADINFEILPGFSFGPRVEYRWANDAVIMESVTDRNSVITEKASILPLMLGFQYIIRDDGNPLSYGLGIFMGYGFVNFTKNWDDTYLDGTKGTDSFETTGGSETAEMFLRADYKIEDSITFGILAGYTRANAVNMKYNKVSSGLSYKAGDIWMDYSGHPMVVSFNGFFINASLILDFDFSGK